METVQMVMVRKLTQHPLNRPAASTEASIHAVNMRTSLHAKAVHVVTSAFVAMTPWLRQHQGPCHMSKCQNRTILCLAVLGLPMQELKPADTYHLVASFLPKEQHVTCSLFGSQLAKHTGSSGVYFVVIGHLVRFGCLCTVPKNIGQPALSALRSAPVSYKLPSPPSPSPSATSPFPVIS